MVFLAARKIFQPVFVFNGNDNPAAGSQVLFNQIQKIFKGRFTSHVALSVLKHADQKNIIEIVRQIRFNVLEIAHMDSHIFTFRMAVGIYHAPLFGKVHTGHLPRFPGKSARNGAAAASHLQHLFRVLHGNPVHNVFPERG